MQADLLDRLKSPDFDHWTYSDDQLLQLCEVMLKDQAPDYCQSQIFGEFLRQVQANYYDNPFHNFKHGFTVLQMMYYLIHLIELRLSQLDKLALLISALCHDLQHPGLTNMYQIQAMTDLAITYNNQSVLENLHCASTFRLLIKYNFLQDLTKVEFQTFRAQVIGCILATDVSKQSDILAQVQKINFNWQDHKLLGMKLLMKAADVSLELRPAAVSTKWVSRLFEEFHKETRICQEQSIAIQDHMNPDKTSIPQGQVGFINHVLLPLYTQLGLMFPQVKDQLLPKIEAQLKYYSGQL